MVHATQEEEEEVDCSLLQRLLNACMVGLSMVSHAIQLAIGTSYIAAQLYDPFDRRQSNNYFSPRVLQLRVMIKVMHATAVYAYT